MSIKLKFPAHIRNNAGVIKYVGDIRFGVGEIRTIANASYQRNKDKFDAALEKLTKDGATTHLSVVTKEEVQREEEAKVAKEDELKNNADSPSVIRDYHAGSLHWRKAVTEIDAINDTDVLDALVEESIGLGVDVGSAVFRHLLTRTEGLKRYVK